MGKNVTVTLSNEAWKYLYVVISNVYCTNLKECEVVDGLFNVFMPTAEKYDLEFAQLKQEGQQLERMYQIQLEKNAGKEMIEDTIKRSEANENKKEEISAIMVSLDFTNDQITQLHTHVMHVLSTKRLHKEPDAPGVIGRHNVRLAKEILQELIKYL